MAQMRSAGRAQTRLMLGVDRTYDGHHQTDATDRGCVNVWPAPSAMVLVNSVDQSTPTYTISGRTPAKSPENPIIDGVFTQPGPTAAVRPSEAGFL
jgi:hypothetical protein